MWRGDAARSQRRPGLTHTAPNCEFQGLFGRNARPVWVWGPLGCGGAGLGVAEVRDPAAFGARAPGSYALGWVPTIQKWRILPHRLRRRRRPRRRELVLHKEPGPGSGRRRPRGGGTWGERRSRRRGADSVEVGRGHFTTAASEDPVADTKGLSWALDLGVLFSHMKPSSQWAVGGRGPRSGGLGAWRSPLQCTE